MDESIRQASNITPPTSSATPGEGVSAFSTSTSATSIDLLGGSGDDKLGENWGYYDRYVTIASYGADCYFSFSAATVTIDGSVSHASTAAGATTTVVPAVLKDGVPQVFRLEKTRHRYLNLRAVSSTPTVRLMPSSEKMIGR